MCCVNGTLWGLIATPLKNVAALSKVMVYKQAENVILVKISYLFTYR